MGLSGTARGTSELVTGDCGLSGGENGEREVSGREKTKLFQEFGERRLVFSSSRALFYEYKHLWRSRHPHVTDENPEARRDQGTSPGAQGST